jgi:enoyl-CoA hydratase/carnithine racemase
MELVRIEDRDRVRHVVLNRPEKRNAMNQALLTELAAAMREAGADTNVHCVVLRGEGPVFSAGVDLGELGGFASTDGGRDPLRPFRNVFLAAANLCEEIPKPVICQIHGVCIGGALEVALGCDLRVMASDAKVGLPEVRLGLIPDVGGCSRLPAVVGLGRAKELIMTGRNITAQEAERIGLANRVVEPDELDRAVQALVDELLANSPVAVGRAKRVMDAAAKPALAQTLELEVTAQEVCIGALKEKMAAAGAAAEASAAVS